MSENIILNEENVIIATFNITSENTAITLKNLENMTQIDWGDGAVNSNLTHRYSKVGMYQCKIYNVTSIGRGAFAYCYNLTEIIIPDSVTSIGESAFGWCNILTSIDIPDSVTSIGENAFFGCSALTNITVEENNTVYKSIDGNLYSKDGATLIQYARGKTAASFTVPEGVTSIGEEAFYNCKSLTEIIIPDSVMSIGDMAFQDCSSLTEIIIPNGVTSIGNYVFRFCSNLAEIEIPDSVTSIGSHAFYDCSSLTEVVIPDSVTSIGDYAFGVCRSLTKIVIPEGVTSIGFSAFSNCSSLTSITIGSGITTIRGNWFNVSPITTIVLKNSSIITIEDDDKLLQNALFYVPEESVDTYKAAWSGIIPAKNILPYERQLISLEGLDFYHKTLKEKYLDPMKEDTNALKEWVKQYIKDNFATLMEEYLAENSATYEEITAEEVTE